MYILVEFYNEYNQQGGYFAGVFKTLDEFKESGITLGRQKFEYCWYGLYEMPEKVNTLLNPLDEENCIMNNKSLTP